MAGSEPFTLPASVAIDNCIAFAKPDRVTWSLPGEQALIAAE